MLWHTHRTTDATHFILEQPFQRLAERKMHLFWESTHIVMALDNLSCDIERLDTVRIDSTLSKPLDLTFSILAFCNDALCLGIEHLYEVATYNLSFLLWLAHSCKVTKELVTGIHADNVESKALIVFHHIAELVLAQHSMVHEDTC